MDGLRKQTKSAKKTKRKHDKSLPQIVQKRFIAHTAQLTKKPSEKTKQKT